MALIKTIAELTKFWPVIQTSTIENVLPFIVQAERDYIIPAISQAQYDDLSTAYNAESPSLSDEQTALLEKIQPAITLYAYYLWVPSGQLQIGDNGIRIASTDSMKTAFQWQINDLQRSLLKQAGSAMDDLLSFMEINITDYTIWSASDEYKQFADFFISTAKKFTENYTPLANSRVTFMALRSAMRAVEDFAIQAEISPEYFAELKAQMKGNSLTDANKLVIPYIQKAVAQLAVNRGIVGMMVTIDERGVLVFNNISSHEEINRFDTAPGNIIDVMRKQTDEDGRAYIQLLKNFLKNNIDDYPTYADSDAYDNTTSSDVDMNDPCNNFSSML